MTTNSTTPSRANMSGFGSSAPAQRATDRTRAPQQQTTRTIIRDVPAGPERKIWYECTRCGSEAYREDSHGRHCRLCGSMAVQREWVRPDIAQAEERARRRRAQFTWVGAGPGGGRAGYAEIADADPWKPLPDGDYVIRRKTPRLPVNR